MLSKLAKFLSYPQFPHLQNGNADVWSVVFVKTTEVNIYKVPPTQSREAIHGSCCHWHCIHPHRHAQYSNRYWPYLVLLPGSLIIQSWYFEGQSFPNHVPWSTSLPAITISLTEMIKYSASFYFLDHKLLLSTISKYPRIWFVRQQSSGLNPVLGKQTAFCSNPSPIIHGCTTQNTFITVFELDFPICKWRSR